MKKTKNNNYEMDMCEGAILPKVLLFTIPLILSGVLQLLFNAADIIVVGRFAGNEPLAAVGSTSSLINLLVNVFIGLSVGANVMVARFYGAGQDKELSDMIHTAITTAFASANSYLTTASSYDNIGSFCLSPLKNGEIFVLMNLICAGVTCIKNLLSAA